eukprot:5285066-Alexandrium_andersonii.AAC.1
MGRGNRVVLRARNQPAAPHDAAGGDGDPPRAEQLNTLLTTPWADIQRVRASTQPRAGDDDAWAGWQGAGGGGNLPPAAVDAPDEARHEEHPP